MIELAPLLIEDFVPGLYVEDESRDDVYDVCIVMSKKAGSSLPLSSKKMEAFLSRAFGKPVTNMESKLENYNSSSSSETCSSASGDITIRTSSSSTSTPRYIDSVPHKMMIEAVRKNFLDFLKRLGTSIDIVETESRNYYRIKLLERGACSLAHKGRYKLQMAGSSQQPMPYLPYDGESTSTDEKRRIIWETFDENGKRGVAGSNFRQVDRIRLLWSRLERVYDMEGLVKEEVIDGFFLLHNQRALNEVKITWGQTEEKLRKISDYFGESLGFYFAWLKDTSESLLVPSFLGVLVFIIQLWFDPYGNFDNAMVNLLSISFGLLVLGVGSLSILSWHKKEERLKILWGCNDTALKSKRRRTRDKNHESSSVKLFLRRSVSFIVSTVYIMLTITAICIIFTLPMISKLHPKIFGVSLQGHLPLVSTILNVGVLNTFEFLWGPLARYLTTFEQWKFVESHQNALVLKLFVFRFINYFNAFFYLAWFKDLVDPEVATTATSILKWNLGTIFISNLMQNFLEIGSPATTFMAKNIADAVAVKTDDAPWLSQYNLPTYQINDTLAEDYMEVALQFAFVMLFSSVLPIVPLFAYCSNYVELHSDAYKLLNFYQRPFPHQVSVGIGPWKDMMVFTLILATSVNVGLGIFTFHVSTLTLTEKLVAFLVLEHLLIIFGVALRYLLPSEVIGNEALKDRMARVVNSAIWGDESAIAAAYANLPRGIKGRIAKVDTETRRFSIA